MNRKTINAIAKMLLVGAAFLSLQACAPTVPSQNQVNVASAFETSNVIAVKPYTRTIFSTTDF